MVPERPQHEGPAQEEQRRREQHPVEHRPDAGAAYRVQTRVREERTDSERDGTAVADIGPRRHRDRLAQRKLVDRPDHRSAGPGTAGRRHQQPEATDLPGSSERRAQAHGARERGSERGRDVVEVDGNGVTTDAEADDEPEGGGEHERRHRCTDHSRVQTAL